MTIVTHFSYMKAPMKAPLIFNYKVSQLDSSLGWHTVPLPCESPEFIKTQKTCLLFPFRIHQGKSRWHSYHVLVYKCLYKPCIHLIFWDCAMYFDHGVILNIMTQTNGIYNVWTPQRNLHAKQEKQANNLSHLFLPSVANKQTAPRIVGSRN